MIIRFSDRDDNIFTENQFCSKNAVSLRVIEKSSDDLGVLIWYSGKEPLDAQTIAHEAAHCTIWLCADLGIGVSEDDSEAFAYLCGYIAYCIDKGIVKKDG